MYAFNLAFVILTFATSLFLAVVWTKTDAFNFLLKIVFTVQLLMSAGVLWQYIS